MATDSLATASLDVASAGAQRASGDAALAFVRRALDEVATRLPEIDRAAMELVLLLHRVTNVVVYDLESTVHRPAGWSWSAFRAVFTLWISGPLEPSKLAEASGMSRQAVSALAKTLEADGLIERGTVRDDGRSVSFSLTLHGHRQIEHVFREHNRREREWASVLTSAECATLVGLLGKLAAAGQQPWASHRF